MGRKSCKKQQKRRQQQQLPPGDVGHRYVVDEWCPGCGEFGHTVAICPTQYQEEVEPQPQEEDGWEALLRSMGVPYCCFICRETEGAVSGNLLDEDSSDSEVENEALFQVQSAQKAA
ncbi:UNVERIFIED_CONTAM: hypothetical protein FKN15_078308 [Acipenser sinensis]